MSSNEDVPVAQRGALNAISPGRASGAMMLGGMHMGASQQQPPPQQPPASAPAAPAPEPAHGTSTGGAR